MTSLATLLVAHVDVAGLQRIVQRDARVVLRLDRADRMQLVLPAHTRRPDGLRIAPLRRRADRERDLVERQSVDAAAHRVIDHRLRNARHRIIVVRRERDPEIVLFGLVGGNADLPLGLAVPRLQRVVAERPVDLAVVDRLHRKVVRHEAKARTEPVTRRTPADAIVGARERERPCSIR